MKWFLILYLTGSFQPWLAQPSERACTTAERQIARTHQYVQKDHTWKNVTGTACVAVRPHKHG